jgi:hemerythrin-like domain-containing protein
MDTPHQPHSSAPPVDVRDMIVVHQAFRREFRLVPAAVTRVAAGDQRQAGVVTNHLRFLIRGLHHHHAGEDRLLWPKLRERVPQQLAEAVSVMEEQHRTIAAQLEAATSGIRAWTAHAAAEERDRLATTLAELSAVLDEHLAAEERTILPLAAFCLDVAEWQALERDGIDSLPKSQAALAFGMLMYEADPEVIALMLSRAPGPARLLMPRLAPRTYARHARRVHGTPTP